MSSVVKKLVKPVSKKVSKAAAKSFSKIEEMSVDDLVKAVDDWKKTSNVDDIADVVQTVPTRAQSESAAKSGTYDIEIPDEFLAEQKEKGKALLERAKKLGREDVVKDLEDELNLDPLKSRTFQQNKENPSVGNVNIDKFRANPKGGGKSEVDVVFDRVGEVMRGNKEKISPADMAWLEQYRPDSNVLKQAKAYNAGEDWRATGVSTKEYLGTTRQGARNVSMTKRAEAAAAEEARQQKADVKIGKQLAEEKESRVVELENFRAAEQAKLPQYKKEAMAGGMNAFDAAAEAQKRIDKNFADFAERTSPDLAAEAKYPTPPISSSAPPVSSTDARLAEKNKKKVFVQQDKPTTADKSADAGIKNKEALGKMPGKPYTGWASEYRPDDSIPSATPSVITPSGAKTESEKLAKLQDEFSSTAVTPSEATAKTAKQPKAKAAKEPKAEAAPAPAAEAKAPAAPEMNFKGMSLSQVDEAVKNNPDLKTAAINYAKTKEKASWKNWATRAEAQAAPKPPAAEAAAPKAAPLSKLQKEAEPEVKSAADDRNVVTPSVATKTPKQKPRVKVVKEQDAARVLATEKNPTFVNEATGEPVPAEQAKQLGEGLLEARKGTPDAVANWVSRAKKAGIAVLTGSGFVIAFNENQRANSTENVLVNNLVNSANILNDEAPSAPQGVQTQKVSGGGTGGGAGGGGGGNVPAKPATGGGTTVPGVSPKTAPATGTKPSPIKVESPEDLLNVWNKIQEVAAPMAQLDKATQERLKGQENELTTAIKDATTAYNESIKSARDEAERRETIATWGQIFETLGQAAIKYFAAREGKRLGQRIGSTLQLEKHDWSSDLNRSMEKLKIDMADAKEKFGIAREEAETGRKALTKERESLEAQASRRAEQFTNAAMRERSAQQELDKAMAIERMRLQRAEQSDIARENREAARKKADAEEAEQKAKQKEQGEQTKIFNKQTTSLANLNKAITNKNQGDIDKFATELDVSEEDKKELKRLSTAFKLPFREVPEQIEAIVGKYKPKKPGQAQEVPLKIKVGNKVYEKPANMPDAEWERYIESVGGVPVQ